MWKRISYFIFLATEWNFSIAWHIIKAEKYGEAKYGIDTIGTDHLKSLEKKGIDTENATMYMPASYDLLEEVFTICDLTHSIHFIDIGCGKGRVLAVAAHYGAKKLTGVEFSPALAAKAVENMQIVQSNLPEIQCTIKNNDAFYYPIPVDADVIFMFNPFNDTVMEQVLENIDSSLEEKPREITMILLSDQYPYLMEDYGYKQLHHIQKHFYLQATVYHKGQSN